MKTETNKVCNPCAARDFHNIFMEKKYRTVMNDLLSGGYEKRRVAAYENENRCLENKRWRKVGETRMKTEFMMGMMLMTIWVTRSAIIISVLLLFFITKMILLVAMKAHEEKYFLSCHHDDDDSDNFSDNTGVQNSFYYNTTRRN